MKPFIALLLSAAALTAQTNPASVAALLAPPIHSAEAVNYQLRRYVRGLTSPLTPPRSAAEWTAESARLRRKVLDEVVFHGWPAEWVNGPTRMEVVAELPTDGRYRLRKLRYEVVPGFWTVALLYEPTNLQGKVPAIVNVNGHETNGKAEEYIQKRCINQALQGMVAINPEWIFTGEMRNPHNAHWFGSHIDLAGANAVGLFYLHMRRALDYVYNLPYVDRTKIGVTGLSGGGWQTIVLSALDERVAVAVLVAGYLPAVTFGGIEHAGDNEQTATDLSAVADYPVLNAMRAPKPTLLIYNAEDDCCFRAPRMKPQLYDAVRPFFSLYSREHNFAWHENLDPGTHNYQHENRLASYRFFARHFGRPEPNGETPVDALIKSAEELKVSLPPDTLSLVGVARKLAAQIDRRTPATAGRLKAILRYRDRPLDQVYTVANTKSRGVESRSYRFDFADGLTATGVWIKAIANPGTVPATIILNDAGRKASAADVSDRVNRGEQVLSLELVFTGDAAPPKFSYPDHDRMLVSLGERALGMRVSQLLTISEWMAAQANARQVRLQAAGMRTQVAALLAQAIHPTRFSEVTTRDGITSLHELIEKPVPYAEAPELFCLDLLKEWDVKRN